MTQDNNEKLSKVEHIKLASNGLYGPIPDELEQPTDHFSEDAIQLLKHHGTYQQDDRDARRERRKAGLGRDYKMMVRTKTPGGLMSAEQYLICDNLATSLGQDDMRITSRQGFQFHGVVKGNLRTLIHELNRLADMHTRGACGDVVRNVMAPAIADVDPAFANCASELVTIAQEISDRFLPQSSSYFDLWLDDEKVTVNSDGTVTFKSKAPSKPVEEPIYKDAYLPRKFKIGIATEFDNSVDVYTQDLGLIAQLDSEGRIVGYEVLCGGGLGHSHSKPHTYARLGTHITFAAPDELIAIVEAVVKVQRDFGNREDRTQARLKYTIDRMGVDAFRAKVAEYYGNDLPAAKNIVPKRQPDYLGWHKQADGKNYIGIWVENGRVRDFEGSFQFKSGLRAIIERFKPSVRLTPHHNVVLSGIADADVNAVNEMLAQYSIPTRKDISELRKLEMACPALPLCGLALSEAERAMPAIIKAIEDAGHSDAEITIRMTGCPNSCARPETAEIGLIGRGPGKYNVYVGGCQTGTRMNTLMIETLPEDKLAPTISRLISIWKSERADGETFGDWSHRIGAEKLAERVAESA
ncbi:NADPH-dependent assimilatory sulfite reductase hemoprotein subunit [bacterium]|nr:NADPH-dependent assimilatory sulfite reductase hemoprotein subunit [bacterium]